MVYSPAAGDPPNHTNRHEEINLCFHSENWRVVGYFAVFFTAFAGNVLPEFHAKPPRRKATQSQE
jgi:hypothetical protein